VRSIREPDLREHAVDASVVDAVDPREDPKVGAPAEAREQRRRLDDRAHPPERRGKSTGHVGAEQPDAAVRRPNMPEQASDRGRLPRTVRPEEAEDAARGDRQVQPVERHRGAAPERAELLPETLEDDDVGHGERLTLPARTASSYVAVSRAATARSTSTICSSPSIFCPSSSRT
jgi:hypothetical protein